MLSCNIVSYGCCILKVQKKLFRSLIFITFGSGTSAISTMKRYLEIPKAPVGKVFLKTSVMDENFNLCLQYLGFIRHNRNL